MVERLVRQMVTSISAAAAVSALRRTSSSIGPSWDMAVPIKSRVAARDEVAAMLDRRGPAGAEQDRRVGFLDERRAGDRRRQRVAVMDRDVAPGAVEKGGTVLRDPVFHRRRAGVTVWLRQPSG